MKTTFEFHQVWLSDARYLSQRDRRVPSLRSRSSALSRGFTLVELLVVIAIIACLAGLLLAVLAGAREKVRRVQCFHNLRQWAVALHTYKDDHDDFIPREGHLPSGRVRRDNWANVRDSVNRDVWYNALPLELKRKPASNYASRGSGERPRFYKDPIFHCPSAKFPAYAEDDNDVFFSLAMNSKLIMPTTLQQRSAIRFDSIKLPSSTVLFAEGRVEKSEAKVHPFQLDIELGQPSVYATRFAPRHRKSGNLAFADGHVSSVTGDSVVETRDGFPAGYAIFPGRSVIWCPDPFDDPNQ